MTAEPSFAERVLAELRSARYAPTAWWRFLAESFARAHSDIRRAQAPANEITAIGLLTAFGVFAIGTRGTLLVVWLGWTALVVVMSRWHVGILETPDGRRLPHLGAPNVITLLRAFVVPGLASPYLGIVVVAGLTADGLDGLVARRTATATRFGAWADSTADLAFLPVAAAMLANNHSLPAWAAVLVVLRFAAGVLLVAWPAFSHAELRAGFKPLRWRWHSILTTGGLVAAVLFPPVAAVAITAGTTGGLSEFVVQQATRGPRGRALGSTNVDVRRLRRS